LYAVNDRRVKLLFGPYQPPALRRGDRATCLFRDCDVIITSWTDARTSWPRCRAEGTRGGGSGLLVDEELARAVRNESAAAICHWWGVSENAVWAWRKALGAERMDSAGSRRLIEAASEAGASQIRGKPIPADVLEERQRRAEENNQPRRYQRWTEAEVALLGKFTDAQVAARLKRTIAAVQVMRNLRGIPSARDRRQQPKRRKGWRPFWKEKDLLLLGATADAELAKALRRRTEKAVR
jgi:hypothetical protein